MTNSNQLSTKPSKVLSWPVLVLLVLSFIGFADAAYLTADHYFKLPLPCTLTNGCDTVLHSKYATVGPVPTALFGVLYYLAIWFLMLLFYTSENEARQSEIVRFVFGITGVGLIVSGILVYLQFSVIGAICLYCTISAAITTILFLTAGVLFRTRTVQ